MAMDGRIVLPVWKISGESCEELQSLSCLLGDVSLVGDDGDVRMFSNGAGRTPPWSCDLTPDEAQDKIKLG